MNMGSNEFKVVAEKIQSIFPCENANEYYVSDESGIRPRGKLAERFYNVIKELKNQKILVKTKQMTEVSSNKIIGMK